MKHVALLLGTTLLVAAAVPCVAAPDRIKAAIADSARPEADTKRDENRKPAQMLAFAGIRPGAVVVDLLPGGGYFTRLFAKAVEPGGRVYAYVGSQSDARLKSQGKDPDNQLADLKKSYKNLGVIHGPLAQFVTSQPVDVVWTSDNYHDVHNASFATSIADMNKAIYKSLKPGGYYVIIDYIAADSTGADVTEALHRIKLATVKQEVAAAGFKLVAEGDALHNPADDGTKKVFEADIRGKADQFMLKFQKPHH
jgi:predicted methyltransferase